VSDYVVAYIHKASYDVSARIFCGGSPADSPADSMADFHTICPTLATTNMGDCMDTHRGALPA
jgi:hypothetical protein